MMKKVALGALFVGVLAACGNSHNNTTVVVQMDGPGSNTVDASLVCNVLTQAGCMTGERCTWFHDDASQPPLGHLGCATIAATPAQIGAACTFGAPGATGFDNCDKGAVCTGGICKQICDQNGGAPTCASGFSCATYHGLFGNGNNPLAAGVCDPTCDPLTQKTSTGLDHCGGGLGSDGSPINGCYGGFVRVSENKWSCAGNVNPTNVHRTACSQATGCSPNGTNLYVNGCAAGNVPIIFDATSETMFDCGYICSPLPHYAGNIGGARGSAPYDCSSANHAPGANEECVYEWYFEEIYSGGMFTAPDTSGNLYGICHDPTKANNELMDQMGNPVVWPKCSQLPNGSGGSDGSDAVNWGCVPYPTMLNGSLPKSPFHAVAGRLPLEKLERN